MEQDIYLYPGSQSEAHRLGEAALWDASFHAKCRQQILKPNYPWPPEVTQTV